MMKISKKLFVFVLFFASVYWCDVNNNMSVVNAALDNTSSTEQSNEDTIFDMEFIKTQNESIQQYKNLTNALKTENTMRNAVSSSTWYGGGYIGDDGSLVVLVVDNNQEKTEVIQSYTKNENINIQNCLYSYDDLMTVINSINANLTKLTSNGIVLKEMYEDVMKNRVVIRIEDLTKEKEEFIRDIIDLPCMFIENDRIVTEEVIVENNSANAVKLASSADLLAGGDVIKNNATSKYSTLGFCAHMGSIKGFVVSGHSAKTLYDTFDTLDGENMGYVSKTAFYNNSTADAAFVTASNYVDTSNYIDNYQCTSVSDDISDMPINSTVYIYRGYAGLYSSGKIVSHYYTSPKTYDADAGEIIYLLRQTTATYESNNGDSGSPIFVLNIDSTVKLLGIHNGRVDGDGYSIFSRYSNIVDELGISAITN